jgi:hypothetical protein
MKLPLVFVTIITEIKEREKRKEKSCPVYPIAVEEWRMEQKRLLLFMSVEATGARMRVYY